MTVEEALLAVVGLIAVVLLFLGLADALEGDPRRSRRPRRRAARPEARRPAPSRTAVTAASDRPDPRPLAPEAEPAATAPQAPREVGPEWRDRVAALIRGRETEEARALLDPALARAEVAPDTAGFLLDVAATAVARDLWRLRRALRRGGGDEAPLGGALATTRLLLDAAAAQALPREQRRRVGGRLWRGYTRLGLRRWRAGNFEAGIESLFQALDVPGIGERRRRLARDLLMRTLEDMAGQSLELIPQIVGGGDRTAARERAERLLGYIHRMREDGVSPEDLAVAGARARQLLDHIEQAPVR
jgi:hypothetical protein